MIEFYHGLIGDHQHSLATQALLARHGIGIYAPDIPFLRNDHADVVAGWGVKSADPKVRIGNSIGCCLAVAAAGPEDALILTAPPFDYGRGIVPLQKDRVKEWVSGLYVSHGSVVNEQAILENASRQVLGLLESRSQIMRLRQYKKTAMSFWDMPALARHQDRVTFVIGDQDFTTPVADFCAFVERKLPRAHVEVWADCGHAVPLDAPSRLAQIAVRAVEGLQSTQMCA